MNSRLCLLLLRSRRAPECIAMWQMDRRQMRMRPDATDVQQSRANGCSSSSNSNDSSRSFVSACKLRGACAPEPPMRCGHAILMRPGSTKPSNASSSSRLSDRCIPMERPRPRPRPRPPPPHRPLPPPDWLLPLPLPHRPPPHLPRPRPRGRPRPPLPRMPTKAPRTGSSLSSSSPLAALLAAAAMATAALRADARADERSGGPPPEVPPAPSPSGPPCVGPSPASPAPAQDSRAHNRAGGQSVCHQHTAAAAAGERQQ